MKKLKKINFNYAANNLFFEFCVFFRKSKTKKESFLQFTWLENLRIEFNILSFEKSQYENQFIQIFLLEWDNKSIPRVTFIRWATALPHGTVGSLRPAFAPARLVGLAVKLPFAFTLNVWFPSRLREPLRASVTFYEVSAPEKLPTWNCQVSWFKDHH